MYSPIEHVWQYVISMRLVELDRPEFVAVFRLKLYRCEKHI
jgi:hypothetical protein